MRFTYSLTAHNIHCIQDVREMIRLTKRYTAPAPRLILRLLCLTDILEEYLSEIPVRSNFIEIGSGLGDTAALIIESLEPNCVRLFELSAEAREILANRFNGDRVEVLRNFEHKVSPCNVLAVMEVLEHVEDDEEFLSIVSSSMTSNGWLIGSVPAYKKKWQDSDVLVGHYRRYEKLDLECKLRESGFERIDIRSYGFPLLNMLDPVRKIYYRYALSKTSKSRVDRTAESGVSRNLVNKLNSNIVFLLCNISHRFRASKEVSRNDDGFIFICRKAD